MHAGLPKVSRGDLVSALKSLEARAAVFFSLFEKESETLVGWEEYDLWPGESRPYRGQFQSGTELVASRPASRDPWLRMASASAKREVTEPGRIDVQAVTMPAR